MARAYAKRLGVALAIVDKRRISPESAEVMNILGDIDSKDVIIVDDMVATAGSLVEAAKAVQKVGAQNIYAAVTHAVLSGSAVSKIEGSPINVSPAPSIPDLFSIRAEPSAPALQTVTFPLISYS